MRLYNAALCRLDVGVKVDQNGIVKFTKTKVLVVFDSSLDRGSQGSCVGAVCMCVRVCVCVWGVFAYCQCNCSTNLSKNVVCKHVIW